MKIYNHQFRHKGAERHAVIRGQQRPEQGKPKPNVPCLRSGRDRVRESRSHVPTLQEPMDYSLAGSSA